MLTDWVKQKSGPQTPPSEQTQIECDRQTARKRERDNCRKKWRELEAEVGQVKSRKWNIPAVSEEMQHSQTIMEIKLQFICAQHLVYWDVFIYMAFEASVDVLEMFPTISCEHSLTVGGNKMVNVLFITQNVTQMFILSVWDLISTVKQMFIAATWY